MRKDVSKDNFKLGVKFDIGTRMRALSLQMKCLTMMSALLLKVSLEMLLTS